MISRIPSEFIDTNTLHIGLPRWLSGKETTCQCRRHRFDPWVGKIPCRKKWQPTPVFLPGKSHGQRSLAGYSPWGRKELDTTERLSTHTHTRFISQGQARPPAETCGKSFSQRIQVWKCDGNVTRPFIMAHPQHHDNFLVKRTGKVICKILFIFIYFVLCQFSVAVQAFL